ncbi:MAG TPA: YtxH domain-containing protein [Gemmatimonadaceae bacterium]|nr:YtxH domain-containing protein [Gemmatimonadaceae bacterium]
MNDRPGFSGTHMLLAVLGGAAAGAAVALLVAPRSGRETRAAIGEYVRDGKEKARNFPPAVKAGANAARKAFVDVMNEEAVV